MSKSAPETSPTIASAARAPPSFWAPTIALVAACALVGPLAILVANARACSSNASWA